MKAKLKIDSQQIKDFFIQHGEKFVMLAALAILVLFGLAALKRETLPENLQPGRIDKRTSDATEKVITNSHPPEQLVPKLNFIEDVHQWKQDVPQVALIIKNPLSIPTFPNLPKRSDPTLYPVVEMHVQPFRGALITNASATPAQPPKPLVPLRKEAPLKPAKPAPADKPLPQLIPGPANVAAGPQPISPSMILPGPPSSGYAELRDGMLVTGLLPYAEQRAEFEQCFAHARRAAAEAGVPGGLGREGSGGANHDLDAPHYVWCRLERTDTTDGSVKQMDFGDFEQVSADFYDKKTPKLAERQKSIRAAHINKTFLAEEDADHAKWGAAVPEVADPDYVAAPWITWPLPPIALHDWGRDGVHPKVPLAGAVAAGKGGPEVPVKDGQEPPPSDFAPDKEPPRLGRGAPLSNRAGAPGGGDANAAPENTAPYRMFRFVDFDVVPGHAYQYRVQFLLRNPNFGLDAQLLSNPDPNSPLYRETPWSEKSAAGKLPPDTRFIAGEVERRKRAEPRVKNLGVLRWDHKSALDLLLQRDKTELGEVLNYVGKEATLKDVADVVTHMVQDIDTEFLTQAAPIDMRGNDEMLPGTDKLMDASEELLLTNVNDLAHPEQMRLVVVNHAIDQQAVEQWEGTHKVPKDSENPQGNPGGLLGPLGSGLPPVTKPKTPAPVTPKLSPFPTNPKTPLRRPTGQ